MKTKLLTICLLIFLSSCSEQQTVNYSDTYEKDGLIYLKYSKGIPFTGYVTKEENGYIKEGKRHGEYIKYFSEDSSYAGQIKEKGKYFNGLRNGEFKQYHTPHRLSLHAFYNKGIKNGKYTEYCSDKRVMKSEDYNKNGFPIGEHQHYHCYQYVSTFSVPYQLSAVIKYELKDGKYYKFLSNHSSFCKGCSTENINKLRHIRNYEYSGDLKNYDDSKWKYINQVNYYYKSTSQYTSYLYAKITEEYKTDICGEVIYFRKGPAIFYYDNGNIEAQGNYKSKREGCEMKRVRHGKFTWYDKEGNITQTEDWFDGERKIELVPDK
mgnify:CR=1 FL=1